MTDRTTSNLKDSILSWKSKKIPNAVILKFHGHRYLGLLRKDKKGQEYWRYHPLNQNSEPEQSGQTNPVMDNIQKFQERKNQTEQLNNHDNNSHSFKE